MKKLIILSAGGTARELFKLVNKEHEVLGYLDDQIDNAQVIGKIHDFKKFTDQGISVISALGSYKNMSRRKEVLNNIPLNAFVSFYSNQTLIYDTLDTNKGTTIFPYSIISTNVTLGVHCFIYHNCVVSHDSCIGDYTILSNSVTVSGGVIIGENSYIGAGSTVLEGSSIGDNCIVAAGATVIDAVPENSIYISKDNIKPNHYA
ncbi:MAG: hypothetical protein KJO81_10020 [Gammaproteobacteria bacterium]|nr:hypothetical protein [Gammaproteobacteria bacterium]MBT8125149.1 hypothetical protein [Gammaproteobacteria bacterium]NNC68256.1 hypothetical protein [Gammaproteobacteria bacterium]